MRRGGFSLVDLLVSLGVIALLMGIMLPSLGAVRETGKQIACRSNLRQFGFGFQMYADDWKDQLPPSTLDDAGTDGLSFIEAGALLRGTGMGRSMQAVQEWIGIGSFYGGNYLTTADLYYCPSHRDAHTRETYDDQWRGQQGMILGNYSFRGEGSRGIRRYSFLQPDRTSILADAVWSDVSTAHASGLNLLRADQSIAWFDGLPSPLAVMAGPNSSSAQDGESDTTDPNQAWEEFDLLATTIRFGY